MTNQRMNRCSFCGRREKEVKALLAGDDAFICEECVEHAKDYLDITIKKKAKDSLPSKFPAPSEIKKKLDE